MPFSTSDTSEERRLARDRVTIDLSQDRRLRGRAITFHSLSKVMFHPGIGPFRERILPQAVNRTLTGSADVKALWDHDTREVLGSRNAGTLVLTKTPKGLDLEIDPPKWASRYVETVERGDVDGMSFGFVVMPGEDGEEWDLATADGIPIRSVKDMLFREVSVTPFPAYNDTDVGVSQRSIDLFLGVQRKVKASYNWREKWQAMSVIAHEEDSHGR
jgi:uncharacterized protein